MPRDMIGGSYFLLIASFLTFLFLPNLAFTDVYHSGHITINTTWTAAYNNHIINGDVTVDPGATLTIEAGCILKFTPDVGLIVEGMLNVNGTDAKRVKFTKNADGYWAGVSIADTGTANFQYCTIEYADVGITGNPATLTNNTVQNCNTGIKLIDLTSFVSGTGNMLSDNAMAGLHCRNCDGIVIGGFTFKNNLGYGAIFAEDCPSFAIGSNTMTGNAYPLSMSPLSGPDASSTIPVTGNTNNAIRITSGDVDGPAAWPKFSGLDYYLTGNLNITGSGSLTLDPGNTLKIWPGFGLNVAGTLNAVGTGTDKIKFTRGSGANWSGIVISDTGKANLQYCTIEYADVGITGSPTTFTNNAIQNCDTGIKLIDMTSFVSGTGNVLSDNATAGLHCKNCDGVLIGGFSFENNLGYGAIFAEDCPSFIIGSNTMTGNTYPLSMTPLSMPDAFSTIPGTGNTNNGINVTAGDIDANVTWPGFADLSYHITGDLNITETGSLALNPGTVLKTWPGFGINVAGTLNAVGTGVDKIKLTKGNITNWAGIAISDTGTVKFEHCIIEYADVGITGNPATFKNNSIQNCDTGIKLIDLTSFVSGTGNIIANNATAGLHCQNCDGIVISGFTFQNNLGYGAVYAQNCPSFTVGSNTMTGNIYPLSMTPLSMPNASSNIPAIGNTNNGINITSGDVDTTVAWPRFSGLDYYIKGDLGITETGSLTLDPGIILKIWPGLGINVDGNLNAVGTDVDKIKFTRGDSTNWAGIVVSETGAANIQHCIIEYANNGVMNYVDIFKNNMVRYCAKGVNLKDINGVFSSNIIQNCDNGIYIQNATPAGLPITNCLIAKNKYGINLYGSGLEIVNCTIVYNTSAGVYCRNPSFATALNCIIRESIIHLEGSSDMAITYSDVQTGYPGEGNIDADPLFESVTTGDYHLNIYSPCIGAGTLTDIVPEDDIEGNSRPDPMGSRPDMGAYESPLDKAPSITILTPNGGEKIKGGSVYDITWETTSGIVNHVNLWYSTDGGQTYPEAIVADVPDNGKYQWTTPLIDSSTISVKAVAEDASNGQMAFDISDGNFIIDSTVPETTHELSGTPGENGWYISDVTVSLEATDNLSGVKETKYKVNDQEWMKYAEPFIIDGSTVKYHSVDNAGNTGADKQIEVNIDKTGPGAPVVADDGLCTTDNSQLHAAWTAYDNESGISEYQYAIGTTPGGNDIVDWTSTGEDKEVTAEGLSLTLGPKYYFSVKAKNNAGLWSEQGNSDGIIFLLPAIGVDPSSLSFEGEAGVASSESKKLNITNTGCGILDWSISSGEPWLKYSPDSGSCMEEMDEVEFSVDATELSAGIYNTTVNIVGANASNTPHEVLINFKVVEILSITINKPDGGEKIKGGSIYGITWEAVGNDISHIKLLYSTDGGNTYPNTIVSETTNDGLYEWTAPLINSFEVRVKAVAEDSDNKQLISDVSDGNFVIDSMSPETEAEFFGSPGENGWYLSNVNIKLNAKDNLAGVKETKYKLDNQPWAKYANPIVVTGSTLRYYSEDNVGNVEIEKQLTVNIDKTPPSKPVVTDDGICTAYRSRLHAIWISSDPESDIGEYQYAIGTTPGGTNVVNWVSVGNALEVTNRNVNLILGQTYYFSVKAKNKAGLWSPEGVSDGIICQLPEIRTISPALVFEAVIGWGNPEPKKLGITSNGCGSFEWAITENVPWLSCEPLSGIYKDEVNEVTFSVDIAHMGAGTYNETIIINALNVSNAPMEFPVRLEILLESQRHILGQGWNLISFKADRCYYIGNPPTDQPDCVKLINVANLGFPSLRDWFSSVVKPDNSWQMVVGPNGAMDVNSPKELHSLKYMSPCFGYYVKMLEPGELILNAMSFANGCNINLREGWNLVGYPIGVGYHDTEDSPNIPGVERWEKVNAPVAESVFGSIQGKYSMIIGQYGTYNPGLPLENSLHFIAPGHSYWIKMKTAGELVYP